jgi:hypothetical protein
LAVCFRCGAGLSQRREISAKAHIVVPGMIEVFEQIDDGAEYNSRKMTLVPPKPAMGNNDTGIELRRLARLIHRMRRPDAIFKSAGTIMSRGSGPAFRLERDTADAAAETARIVRQKHTFQRRIFRQTSKQRPQLAGKVGMDEEQLPARSTLPRVVRLVV